MMNELTKSMRDLTTLARNLMLTVVVLSMMVLSYGEITLASGQQGNLSPKPEQQTVQSVVAKQAALVTEFEVNGLKVLLKKREGSLTVAAGLFLRGGAANTTAQNAGIEQLMLNASTEASTGFPREKMRSELSRMGTTIGTGSNYDYSVLARTE